MKPRKPAEVEGRWRADWDIKQPPDHLESHSLQLLFSRGWHCVSAWHAFCPVLESTLWPWHWWSCQALSRKERWMGDLRRRGKGFPKNFKWWYYIVLKLFPGNLKMHEEMQRIKSLSKVSCFPPANMQMWPDFWPHWASSCHLCHVAAISTPADQALAPCRSSVRGFLLSQMVSPVLVPCTLAFWWPLYLGRKWWGRTWPDIYSQLIPGSFIPSVCQEPTFLSSPSIPQTFRSFFSVKAKTYCDRWSVIHATRHLRK